SVTHLSPACPFCHSFSFFSCSLAHRDLPSFPTRRSSDLEVDVIFYDTTTAEFALDEGDDGLRRFGHSKDGRWTPQVVIALAVTRSEEHTSELQSRENLVCRLLLEKKKQIIDTVALIIVGT